MEQLQLELISINGWAAATLICEENYAKENGLDILARIKSCAVNGCDPEVMGLGPIGASRKAMDRAGINSADLGVVELNEALLAKFSLSFKIWN